MSDKQKLLQTAIENKRFDVAAHALVYGAVQAQVKSNGGKGSNGKKGSS